MGSTNLPGAGSPYIPAGLRVHQPSLRCNCPKISYIAIFLEEFAGGTPNSPFSGHFKDRGPRMVPVPKGRATAETWITAPALPAVVGRVVSHHQISQEDAEDVLQETNLPSGRPAESLSAPLG